MSSSVARRWVAPGDPGLSVATASRRSLLRAGGAFVAACALPTSPGPLAATTAAAAPGAARPASAGPILILGDSLSAEYGLPRGSGWVALLEKRLGESRRIVNASISGETTSGGRSRLPKLLASHSPDIVVIELGGNDALRGLPLSVSEENLREMVRASHAAGARPLLLGMRMPPNYGRSYGEQFEAVYRRVAQSERVPLVPFFLEAFAEKTEYFQPDRIHPAERAQPLMLEAVLPALTRLLEATPRTGARR